MPRTRQKYELAGKRFGSWTVLSRTTGPTTTKSYWNCRCDCGVEKRQIGYELVKGVSISCGCVPNPPRKKPAHHPLHTLYSTWAQMKARCYYARNPAYKYYGAIGVFVCARWLDGENGLSGFQCFLTDMGERPSPSHTIDRWPDKRGPYSPENCRWATKKQQAENRDCGPHTYIRKIAEGVFEYGWYVKPRNFRKSATVYTPAGNAPTVAEAEYQRSLLDRFLPRPEAA